MGGGELSWLLYDGMLDCGGVCVLGAWLGFGYI